MPKRPPGRPKAAVPRDVFVGVRLTEAEAERLCRIAGEQSLSAAIRQCIHAYGTLDLTMPDTLDLLTSMPETPRAMLAREVRKARRATAAPQPALEAQIGRALPETGEALAADAARPVG